MIYLAHENQALVIHLRNVANKATEFSKHFSGEDHARLAGLLHDLGKTEKEFQKRVNKEKAEKLPHAHHGAALVLAETKRGAPIWPVAFAINGHHAGLHNRGDVQKRISEYRKAARAEGELTGDKDWSGHEWPLSHFGENLPDWLKGLHFDARQTSEGWRAVDLYTRFLFSALVDADRLDTEANDPDLKSKKKVEVRRTWNKWDARELLRQMENYVGRMRADAEKAGTSEDVMNVRQDVAEACRKAGSSEKRFFSLTVPTGGGKTLASMLFALNYAKAHQNIRRVIVVIPYLSIIQQSAKEFENAFGDNWVLEHHSQASEPEAGKDKDTDRFDLTKQRLAAENWDAPIIVTTSVQFFDSLFSRTPGDARKLHNIAQSVVIFDEVQTLPPRLMQPILDVLRELTNPKRPYECAAVLCTATQPALLKSEDLACGLEDVCPILPDEKVAGHFKLLRRTDYPDFSLGEPPTMSWMAVASEMLRSPRKQGLAVVNTRKAAREIFEAVQKEAGDGLKSAVFHLSTWMYPAHRMQVLDEVRRRLGPDNREPCLLVSTQCIEAGVDVDFPALWRAYGPYDSIVQAAGRCNRNGRLKDAQGRPMRGQVRVFYTENEKMPKGLYEAATNQTDLLRRLGLADPHNPVSFTDYFRLLYQLSVPDECEIQRERGQLHFENVGKLFQFIEDNTFSVLVTDFVLDRQRGETKSRGAYEAAKKRGFFLAEDWRLFQKNVVNLPKYNLESLLNSKFIEPAISRDTGLFVLTGEMAYSGGLNGFGLDFSPNYSERITI